MPVRLTPRPAPEEMLTIRPQWRSFIEGTTARVHRNALYRLACTTASQSSSENSSIGRPTWPTTPPAVLTRMSTPPTESKNALTSLGLVRWARSCPPHAHPRRRRAAPRRSRRRCRAPCRSPPRSGRPAPRRSPEPPVREQLPHLGHAGVPDDLHVLIRARVGAAQHAVRCRGPDLRRVELSDEVAGEERLGLGRHVGSGHP